MKKWIQRQEFLEIFVICCQGWFCKRIWFPFGRNGSEQNEDDGATRSETREIQVVCFAYIFQTIFETRTTDRLSLFVCSPVHARLPAVARKRHEAKVARAGMLT